MVMTRVTWSRIFWRLGKSPVDIVKWLAKVCRRSWKRNASTLASRHAAVRGAMREPEPDIGRIGLDARRQENFGPSTFRGYAGVGDLTPPWSVERKCASPRRAQARRGCP